MTIRCWSAFRRRLPRAFSPARRGKQIITSGNLRSFFDQVQAMVRPDQRHDHALPATQDDTVSPHEPTAY